MWPGYPKSLQRKVPIGVTLTNILHGKHILIICVAEQIQQKPSCKGTSVTAPSA